MPELVIKFIVQISIVLVIIDIVWLFIMSFVWTHENNDSDYWKGLSTMHSMVRCAVYGELILSTSIIGILFYYYYQRFKVRLNPLDFNYNMKNNEEMMNL